MAHKNAHLTHKNAHLTHKNAHLTHKNEHLTHKNIALYYFCYKFRRHLLHLQGDLHQNLKHTKIYQITREIRFIQNVPLATDPGWLADRRSVSQQLGALQTHSFSFLTQRTYSCSNFVAISSLVLELLKKRRVR